MASEKPEKREKKGKKQRAAEEAGVKKDKKDKKEKREKKEKLAAALEDQLQADAAAQDNDSVASDNDEKSNDLSKVAVERTVVPFAVPLADEKGHKRIYKTVAKASKRGSLKRGVKEVVKSLRKSTAANPSLKTSSAKPTSVVILAGDISPPDVLSHLPVMCETAGAPFIFVTTRAELGKYAKTKRPTSVVMVQEKAEGKRGKEKEGTEEEKGEYEEAFVALVKLAQKEYQKQAFWAKGERRDM